MPSLESKNPEEIFPLTGLRFIAALYVFIFHIEIRWPLFPASSFLTNLLSQGAVGMSLFFILSGFVLANRYGDGRGNYRSYLINRFSRIYPVYAVVALLTLPWIGISLGANSIYDLLRQLTTLSTLVVADVFLIQAWFPQFFSYWNNGGSWSISVEAFCYVLLPFILILFAGRSDNMIKLIAFIAYILAVLPGLSLILFYDPHSIDAYKVAYYSMPIYRLPEFVLGICTYFAVRRLKTTPSMTASLQLLTMAILIAYLGLVGPKLPAYITHNWIVLPVIALTIFSTAQSYGLLSKLLASRPMVWAGKISYSFYSFQLLILLLLKSHHDKLVKAIPALADNQLLLLLSFIVLMAISAAGYHLIEEPMRRRIKKFYSEKRPLAKIEIQGVES